MNKAAKVLAIGLVLAAGMMSGCGGSGSGAVPGSSQDATMVVMGTDSPTLANVVSFEVPISGISLSGSGNTSVSVLDTPAAINFSRLVGLRTLIDIQPVKPGSYTSATITFGGPPLLSVLNAGTPPTVTPITTVLGSVSTTVNFSQPLSVGNSQDLGLLLDFRIGKSIPVDSSGNIITNPDGSVTVTPDIQLTFLSPEQAKFEIDDLYGGVQSVNSDGSFVLQGPGGRQFTISTGSSTEWEPSGQSLSTLSNTDIVEVEGGIVDPATGMVQASEIDVFPDKFVLTGLVTYVSQPPSSTNTICAPTVSLLVRSAIPGVTGSAYAQNEISQVSLTGSENYWVGRHDWLGSLFNFGFNSCTLVPGQAVTIGGTLDSSGDLVAKRVVLTVQGFSGLAASGVASDNTFQFAPQGLSGVLLPNPVTVQLIELPLFSTELENLSSTGSITTGMKLHVAGLVLYNTTTNTTNILAGRVDQPEP